MSYFPLCVLALALICTSVGRVSAQTVSLGKPISFDDWQELVAYVGGPLLANEDIGIAVDRILTSEIRQFYAEPIGWFAVVSRNDLTNDLPSGGSKSSKGLGIHYVIDLRPKLTVVGEFWHPRYRLDLTKIDQPTIQTLCGSDACPQYIWKNGYFSKTPKLLRTP